MTQRPTHPEAALREAVLTGNVVFVAGTGVTMSATYDPIKKESHPQASWTGLLTSGLNTAERMGQITNAKKTVYLNLLKEDPTTQNLISTATAVTNALGGAQSTIFEQWLKDTIGGIKPLNRDLIDALHSLREAKCLLATTNYDDILLDSKPDLTPITWKDGDEIVGAQRHKATDKVIYLHGYWQKPETVILDGRSYDKIARHPSYREDLAVFWRTTTWVYVGCGVSGLNDPDFGLLLEQHGERAKNAGHWDFCIVQVSDQAAFQKHFDDLNLNILAVSCGKDYNALPAFLRSLLPTPAPVPAASDPIPPLISSIPKIPTPPAFYAEHDYIGRHTFVGRANELQILSDWAQPSDPTNVLLFEAIGGNGKSMLTWEWATKHATSARTDWAGRFWYSFYEKGAIMRDFCQHALAYMTGEPLEKFNTWPTPDLRKALLTELHAQPWLLILDGLERVLVAYHRIDASEVPDEEANHPTDKVLNREPCDAIRDEDTDLLRALAAAKPSKILISSRLIPRVLLNEAGIPLPGVKPLALPGLDEPDAEKLLRICGIQGTSADIRYYLTNYCANHPLVIGVLAGLINSPGPHRGNFDAWAADPEYGAKLNLASLDLIQSRNHILRAALDALEPASRQLLSTLALLSSAVDYPTVSAFNPHLPPEPEEVTEPIPPEENWQWDYSNDEEKIEMQRLYETKQAQRNAYLQAWRDSTPVREAQKKLTETIADLEHRGLLQYDAQTQRYDLHPVVRGVAAGGMKAEDKELYGQRVVDHYSSQPHDPYKEAKTMDDVENGMHIVRTLLKLGHFQEALDAYRGDLSNALFFNLEANIEVLSLIRPFFPSGWEVPPKDLDTAYLMNEVALALARCGERQKAIAVHTISLQLDLKAENWVELRTSLNNIGLTTASQNLLARTLRINNLAVDLATASKDKDSLFVSLRCQFNTQSRLGQYQVAECTWQLMSASPRPQNRAVYGQGDAEYAFAMFQFRQGILQEEQLIAAAKLSEGDRNRPTLRNLHWLRGIWRLEQGEWALAAASFDTALQLARERRIEDADSETGLALAKLHLGQITADEARTEAEHLTQLRDPDHRTLAMLWLAIGDHEQAKHHSLAAYTWAWADGEPYVRRYELTKTTELLHQLNVPIPNLPPYDPAQDEPFPWEADVRAAIEKLKTKNN